MTPAQEDGGSEIHANSLSSLDFSWLPQANEGNTDPAYNGTIKYFISFHVLCKSISFSNSGRI